MDGLVEQMPTSLNFSLIVIINFAKTPQVQIPKVETGLLWCRKFDKDCVLHGLLWERICQISTSEVKLVLTAVILMNHQRGNVPGESRLKLSPMALASPCNMLSPDVSNSMAQNNFCPVSSCEDS